MIPDFLTLTLTLLLYVSVATSHVVRNFFQYEGFQCHSTFIPQDFLRATIIDAQNKISQGSISITKENNSMSPEARNYPYRLTEKEGGHLMWPLVEKNNLIPNDSPNYFLVLRGLKNLEPLNVAQWFGGSFTDCEPRNRQSKIPSNLAHTGYRCPTEIYPDHVAQLAARHALKHIDKTQHLENPKSFPVSFDGKYDFGNFEPVFRWPINVHGKFSRNGFSFIILNKHGHLLGMLHRRDETFLECKPTHSDTLQPKFINSIFQQEPASVSPDEVDVFQCTYDYITPDLVINEAIKAAQGFLDKRHHTNRVYPLLYKESYENGLENLYLWNANFEGYSPYSKKNKPARLYLLVTDFCNVVGMLEKQARGDFKQCVREKVPTLEYANYFMKTENLSRILNKPDTRLLT